MFQRFVPQLVTVNSKRIRILDLEEYVKKAIEKGELERQHNVISKLLSRFKN